MIDLKNLTIEKAHQNLKKGVFTCQELVEEYLKVIKEKNKELNAYLEIYDDILEQVEKAQKEFCYGSQRQKRRCQQGQQVEQRSALGEDAPGMCYVHITLCFVLTYYVQCV